MKNSLIQNKLAFFGGLSYFIAMLSFFGLKILAYFGLLNFPGSDNSLKIVVQVVIMFLLPLLCFKLSSRTSFKKTMRIFSFRKISGKSILYSTLLGILVFVFTFIFSGIWSNFLSLFGYKYPTSSSGDFSVLGFVLSILLTALLPAFCEESSHRGLVLGTTKRNGALGAIVLSGLLFGLMHFNVAQFGYAFVAGMFFASLTLLTKSIYPAMIVHFVNNTISILWSFNQNSDWLHSSVISGISNFLENANIFSVILVELCVVFVGSWLVSMLVLKLFDESKKMSFLRFKKNFIKKAKENNLDKKLNLENEQEIFQIYRNTHLLKLSEELSKNNVSMFQLASMPAKRNLEFILSDGYKLPKKKNHLDYVFYYFALALGIVGTILSFVIGII